MKTARGASPMVYRAVLWSLVVVLVAAPAAARQDTRSSGPAPPEPPDTVVRDAQGRATLRAIRLSEPLRVDGSLDEAVYRDARPISDFVQIEPLDGAPATEKTDAWISFDRDHVYVSFRCWETEPERMIVTEMRRDNRNIEQNDQIAFIFDTFYDRRNGVMFTLNAAGGRADAQVTGEQQYAGDWNPVWTLETGRFDGGWTAEIALPFKSLRYRPGDIQLWGFNARRLSRWKNEISFLAKVPQARGMRGLLQVSNAATVVGLEVPSESRNLEIKPYAIADLTTDVNGSPAVANDPGGDFGADLKYGLTQNLTLDVTYNTDFAQVEADEQQINLTRFNLFLPEKREFFLENAGTFTFGGAGTTGDQGRMGGGDTPVLFYSRRIGIEESRAVPITGGARLTGRVGSFDLGILNVVSGDEPAVGARAANFSVVRVRRNILRRSSVGAIMTGRWDGRTGLPDNEVYGLDGAFAFFQNLTLNTYWARSRTAGVNGRDTSYRGQVEYGGDRYGFTLERLVVGDHFLPQAGFVRRADMAKSFGQLRFSPRPRDSRTIRKVSFIGSHAYVENTAGRLETRENRGEMTVEFHSSDMVGVAVIDSYEFAPRPFRIASDVSIPVGAYSFTNATLFLNFGQQRRLFGALLGERGSFYSGERTALTVRGARVNITNQLAIEPSYALNRVTVREGSFTTHLAGSRVVFTVTPLMFVSALVQYNSDLRAVSTNIRLRWEYQPGSELFVVYNDERDTLARGFPGLKNRAFVVKVNRLFRF